MSASTPPYLYTRATAGAASMDTRATPEKLGHHPVSLVGQVWPLTPPLSAHENSRRPSLTSSGSDVCYGSNSSFSQPTTPVHGSRPASLAFVPPFGHGPEVSAKTSSMDLSAQHLGAAIPLQHMVRPVSIDDDLSYPAPQGAVYASCVATNPAGGLGIDTNVQSLGPAYWPHGAGLQCSPQHHHGQLVRSHFMPVNLALNSDSHLTQPLYPHSVPSSESMAAQAQQLVPCPGLGGSFWSDQPVVVPSQLTPPDEYDPCSYNLQSSPSAGQLSSSFDSTVSGFSGYDSVEAPSPEHDYYTLDDEHVVVKHENFENPPSASKHRASYPRRGSQTAHTRSRKRGSKRKMSSNSYAVRSRVPGFDLRVDSRITIGPDHIPRWSPESIINKPHKCTIEGCESRFERSEHLKRHMGKHTDERAFPCPLHRFKDMAPEKFCDKRIGRSDNACDHFKTHLRRERKGARNKHIEFPEMERLIREEYPEDKATKLLVNLRKWVENGGMDT